MIAAAKRAGAEIGSIDFGDGKLTIHVQAGHEPPKSDTELACETWKGVEARARSRCWPQAYAEGGVMPCLSIRISR